MNNQDTSNNFKKRINTFINSWILINNAFVKFYCKTGMIDNIKLRFHIPIPIKKEHPIDVYNLEGIKNKMIFMEKYLPNYHEHLSKLKIDELKKINNVLQCLKNDVSDLLEYKHNNPSTQNIIIFNSKFYDVASRTYRIITYTHKIVQYVLNEYNKGLMVNNNINPNVFHRISCMELYHESYQELKKLIPNITSPKIIRNYTYNYLNQIQSNIVFK